MIISRTPFRISLFGGGTDYPIWYKKHGGSVLATTINKYCYITCRYLPPFFEHKYRIVYSKAESCMDVSEISHPAVRESLRYLGIDRGVEVHHDGDLPARSGMGSSSSFTVGILNALYALKGCIPSKHQLAMDAIHVEQEVLKETVGSQDQVSAAYGGFNHIMFLRNGEISVRPMTLSLNRIEELNSHLMMFYTGIKRTSSDIAQSYVNNLKIKERQLRLMKDLVEDSIYILSHERDIKGIGELMHEAWHAKKSLSPEVSNSYVDEIYEAALSVGALGGKLTGAGGGGFMIFFVPPGKRKKLREKLNNLIHVPFKFEFGGSQIIFFDTEEDYSSQEKERDMLDICEFKEIKDMQAEKVRYEVV